MLLGDTIGIGLDRAVAGLARMRRHIVAVLVSPVLARGIVAVATAPSAAASAPPPAAGPVLAALLAVREGWLLAEPGRIVGRLLGKVLVGLRLIGVRRDLRSHVFHLAIVRVLGPLAAAVLAMRGPIVAPLVAPATPTPAPRTASALAITTLGRFLGVLADVLVALLALEARLHIDDRALGSSLRRRRLDRGPLDGEVGALHAVARLHGDDDAVAALHVGDEGALVVEDVEGDVGGRHGGERAARVAQELVLERAQHGERHRFDGADDARALAVRALRGGALEHAGAQALARHLHAGRNG